MGNRDVGPEHECRQGRKCKARIRDAEDRWHGAGVEDAGKLCHPCEEHAFAAIAQLADDYAALQAGTLEPRGRVDGPKVKGTADRKIPIPLDIYTLMSDIDDETLRWTVRITRGDPLPASTPERVRRCVAILGSNLGTLVDLPLQRVAAFMPHPEGGDYDALLELNGVDAVLRLAKLHDRARTVLGLTDRKVEPLRDDYCHVCGLAALTIEIDTGIIRCRECRNCWSQEEFARLNNPLMVA